MIFSMSVGLDQLININYEFKRTIKLVLQVFSQCLYLDDDVADVRL